MDTAQQNGLVALQLVATDAANEIGTLRGQTSEANFKVAAKFTDLEKSFEEMKQNSPQGQPSVVPAKAPAHEWPSFIDPVTGKCEWSEALEATQPQEAPKDLGPSDQQSRDGSLHNWYMVSPSETANPMRKPPGYEQNQEQ